MFNSKHTAGRHRLPEVPWRPRKVQRLASLALLGAIGVVLKVVPPEPPRQPVTPEEQRRWENAKARRQLCTEMEQRQREVRQPSSPAPASAAD